MKTDQDYEPPNRSILFILIKVLALLAITALIVFKIQSIPASQHKYDLLARLHHHSHSDYPSSSSIDRQELENAILAIGTTFVFIIHVIGLLAVIREHYWLLFVYSTYLSIKVLLNVLVVLQNPPLMVPMVVSLATGLLTFTLGLMSRNRLSIPLELNDEQI